MDRSSFLNMLIFMSFVGAAIFFLVLGSKLVLTRCERDRNGECITLDSTITLAVEIAELNRQLANAQENLALECVDPTISRDDWNSGRTNVLLGCWQLEHDYTMYYDGDSARPNDLVDWGFCINVSGGYAVQDLYFEDDLECVDQRLYYAFEFQDDEMRLRLFDNEDLTCTRNGQPTGTVVVERELLCSLHSSGSYAECLSMDPQGQIFNDGIVLRRRFLP